MLEDFLHYIWKFKLFSFTDLKTTDNEEITIIKSGTHNYNSGPDFLNSMLKINTQTWAGHVEIHTKASDWYVHHHETDSNYDAVILHVVWEDDIAIYRKDNSKIPTLVLQGLINEKLLSNYQNLLDTNAKWIPCETEITTVDSFVFDNWKERLYFERLERKALEIQQIVQSNNNNNYEATLFVLLAKNFGLKVNGDAFLQFANSFDFSIVRKVRFNRKQLAALFFGQAGFLAEIIEDEYYIALQSEYAYLQHKYKLQPISKINFSFFRMRPNNFPTIRITQLVGLFAKQQNLFSKILSIKSIEDFYKLFIIETDGFWKTHFTFDKVAKRSSSKQLSKAFIDLLLINTIIPLKFLYQQNSGAIVETDYLEILQSIKSEKNSIISKFSCVGVIAKNAFDTQSLLQLKNEYCSVKKCLHCAIGKNILKRN